MKKKEYKNEFSISGKIPGYFLVIVPSVIWGITVFLIAGNFTVSLASSVPIGVTLGMATHQNIKSGVLKSKLNRKWKLSALLVPGLIILLASLFILVISQPNN